MASSDLRNYFKRWPTFYYVVGIVFGPLLLGGLSAKAFLRKYPSGGTTLNIGSGPRVYIRAGVTNVDITPYPGVSIIASAENIPLADNSVARIISDNVLEHIANPALAVREMHRLLAPGGVAYVATPFLYPFHSSPSDYQRWSTQGLIALCKDFEVVEIGVRAGPFSAFTAYLNHLVGLLLSCGSPTLDSLFTNLVMFLTFPLKVPDIIFNHWPGADRMAAALFCVVRKRA